MDIPDIVRVIAAYLDNNILSKLFFSGVIPCLIDLSRDQHFWCNRVETLARRKLEYSQEVDYRETYLILSCELQKDESSMWNKEDNALVVEILLSLNFTPDPTSLVLAAREGSKNITRFLLQHGSIDLEVIRFANTVAAQHGQEEVVKLFLADSRVDLSSQGDHAALLEACRAKNGDSSGNYRRIVKLLLDYRSESGEQVDPGQDNSIIVKVASLNGDNHEIVRLLLADSRVDPTARDSEALQHAVRMGRENTVKLLLRDNRIDPSLIGSWTIKIAIKRGHIGIIKILLADPRVDSEWLRCLVDEVRQEDSNVDMLCYDSHYP